MRCGLKIPLNGIFEGKELLDYGEIMIIPLPALYLSSYSSPK
jgi:hypothetical protein